MQLKIRGNWYRRQNDDHYHVGCPFTADLISMNTADFIFTSIYQDIAGLVERYGRSPALWEAANLVAVGYVDAERSGDAEEREQIGR